MYVKYHIFTKVTNVNLKEGHWLEGHQYQKIVLVQPNSHKKWIQNTK